MKKERRLVTAALPYVNNVPHLGNIVGSHLPADIFARYCKLIGHKAILIGGTDENGTPTELAATRYKISPKELCDHFYKIHKTIYDWFNISYDNFSRTSNKIHHRTSQEFFINIYKKGYITPKKIQLPYCLSCNRQFSDRYIEGICSHCNYEKARGDQCEKCSTLLDPIDLKSPYCVICGSHNIEFRDVEHLFLDLKKLEPKLKAWIIKNKHWKKQVTAMALGWLNKGLSPRSITRDLKWGIKVPLKGYEHLILYVWFEAPIGYISSTKERFKDWKKYWTNKNAKIYHFIGKDNIPFHTIFW